MSASTTKYVETETDVEFRESSGFRRTQQRAARRNQRQDWRGLARNRSLDYSDLFED